MLLVVARNQSDDLQSNVSEPQSSPSESTHNNASERRGRLKRQVKRLAANMVPIAMYVGAN